MKKFRGQYPTHQLVEGSPPELGEEIDKQDASQQIKGFLMNENFLKSSIRQEMEREKFTTP